MTSPTSQAPVPSAPARTTSRFRKPSVALSWIRGIVFFLDIPPVLFRGWCDKTPLARACTIAPCVAVFLAIWFALPHLLTFWTEDYEPSAYYIRFALISTFWPAYIITQARC